uniref:Uncharacterized protein n=1 Tax=Nelumbo nucifera TaxID=4432 RepID=A0A822ZSC7_NELNU|nr:TPA_asm: hypothetical protein HUJ06_018751 [Nelumbo nucifera]
MNLQFSIEELYEEIGNGLKYKL